MRFFWANKDSQKSFGLSLGSAAPSNEDLKMRSFRNFHYFRIAAYGLPVAMERKLALVRREIGKE
jgi:hypothetical protein